MSLNLLLPWLCWAGPLLIDKCVFLSEDPFGGLKVFSLEENGRGGGQANCAPAWLEIEFPLPAAFFFFFNLIISFSRNVPQDEVRAIVPLGIRDPSARQAIISK